MIMNDGLYFGIKLPHILLIARGEMRLTDAFAASELLVKYIQALECDVSLFIDLEHCKYMDSTFIGFVISLSRLCDKAHLKSVVIVRPSEKALNALKILYALPHLNISQEPAPEIPVFALNKKADTLKDRKNIVLMFEAHKILSELSEENKREFSELIEELERALAKIDLPEE